MSRIPPTPKSSAAPMQNRRMRYHLAGFSGGHKATMRVLAEVAAARYGESEANALLAAVLDEIRSEIRAPREEKQ